MVAPAKVRRPAISSARFEIDPVDGNDFFGLFVAFSFVEAWLEGCLSLLKLFVVDGFLSSACGLLLSGFGFSSCGLTSGFGFSGCGLTSGFGFSSCGLTSGFGFSGCGLTEDLVAYLVLEQMVFCYLVLLVCPELSLF